MKRGWSELYSHTHTPFQNLTSREWQRKIKREIRTSEREIKELEREEQKFIKECQKTAKLGARAGTAVKTIAKNVVMARKAKERACMTRAQLNSVAMTLTQQVSMIKVAKCMQKSTDVMHAMNDAIKLPHLNAQMMEMAKEMERAGLIEELIGDALGDAFGGEALEEEVRGATCGGTGDYILRHLCERVAKLTLLLLLLLPHRPTLKSARFLRNSPSECLIIQEPWQIPLCRASSPRSGWRSRMTRSRKNSMI